MQTLPEKQKAMKSFDFTASTLDIPSRWDPRAKQQPTGLIACGAVRAAALFEPFHRADKEKPEHQCVLVFLGAPNHENPNLFSIGEGFGFLFSLEMTIPAPSRRLCVQNLIRRTV